MTPIVAAMAKINSREIIARYLEPIENTLTPEVQS